MACRVYPIVYKPDAVGRDQITVAMIGVSEDDQRRFQMIGNWDIVRAFDGPTGDMAEEQAFHEIVESLTEYINAIAQCSYDELARHFERQSYPTSIQIGHPAVSIADLDFTFTHFTKRFLRF